MREIVEFEEQVLSIMIDAVAKYAIEHNVDIVKVDLNKNSLDYTRSTLYTIKATTSDGQTIIFDVKAEN